MRTSSIIERGLHLFAMAVVLIVSHAATRSCPEEAFKLEASDGASFDRFGARMGIDGPYLVVPSHQDDDAGPQSGSAYVFQYDGSHWLEMNKLTATPRPLSTTR